MTSPRRMPPGDVTSQPDGSTPDMTFSPDRRPSKRPYPFQMCPTNDAGPKEAEMHQLLEVLRPVDTESACSEGGSNPDSGRGASEHGHQELDKAESDSHSEGHQRSSVSSTESAQPFPPPPAMTNPPPPVGLHHQQARPGSGQSPGAGQYPVQVSRGPDIRPHVYTELKTFSPGIHVRQPNNPGVTIGGSAGVGGPRGVDPSKPLPTGGTACTASLPRLPRHGPGNGSHTTTTFGTAPNGSQTITTFGTPRPHCPDGMESTTPPQRTSSISENGPISESPEPCQQNNQMTLESRPLTMRGVPANVRVPEPPRPPSSGIQETNLDLPDPVSLQQQQQQNQNLQENNQQITTAPQTDGDKPKNVTDIKSDVIRDVTDGDTSQDSGVVDAQELCQTIDDAFFKGMVIKQKTLV